MTEDRFRIFEDQISRLCALVVVAGFGGFLLWAGLVPLDEGIVAQGKVVVEDDRRVVQHLEGGIVQEIFVREGGFVNAGDTILTLSQTASLSRRDQYAKQIASLTAAKYALEALQSKSSAPDFSLLDTDRISGDDFETITLRETKLFDQRRAAHLAKIAVLEAREAAANTTARTRLDQIAAAESERLIIEEELTLSREMLENRLARRDAVTGLERNLVQLEGEISRLENDRMQALATARDMASQIDQLEAELSQSLAQEIRDIETELLRTQEELIAAQDILDRAIITAPVSGRVLNLNVSAISQVVSPGETLMEIVPSGDIVIVSLQVRPRDRTMIYEGQKVRTRLSAYRGWKIPEIYGLVSTVSADLKRDPVSGAEYFEAFVELRDEDLEKANNPDTPPGMPVDAFVFSGSQRTALTLLFKPILDSFSRGSAET